MKNIQLQDITLKMWEKTMMPKSEKIDGKYVKTGEKEEQTTYTFLDDEGDKLVFLSNDQKIRNFEGKIGKLFVILSHDSYNKRNTVKFGGFLPDSE